MAIKFFNVRSKEVVTAETEPQIAALWATSDHSPNITQGQDFGWRLAPEVVVEMKDIKADYSQILDIGKRYNMLPEDVDEKTILQFISDRTDAANAPQASDEDYTDEYNEEIRRLERLKKQEALEAATPKTATTTTSTTESLADLEKRVALEERLAAARAVPAATAPDETTTTTTTEKPPTTTTTTTKK